MKEDFPRINFMGMAYIVIIINQLLKVNGNSVKRMVMVNIKDQMDIYKLGNGKMINFKYEFILIIIILLI